MSQLSCPSLDLLWHVLPDCDKRWCYLHVVVISVAAPVTVSDPLRGESLLVLVGNFLHAFLGSLALLIDMVPLSMIRIAILESRYDMYRDP